MNPTVIAHFISTTYAHARPFLVPWNGKRRRWPHQAALLSLLLAATLLFTACASPMIGAPAAAPAQEMASAPSYAVAREEGVTGYSTGGTAPVNDAAYDAVFFKNYGVNPFIDTEDDHLSTFAMDVDTASYSVARRVIQDGYLPDPASVRVEEFVNYFRHPYPGPEEGAFAIHLEGAPSPFGGENYRLLRVGLQAKRIQADERQDASLVFVIDVSGSMAQENRLGLVQRSLRLLVDELRPTDEVAIVVYGSRARVVLPPTSGADKNRIFQTINALAPDGSTNAEEGLLLGYQLAEEMQGPGRITRLILCSDGVANVGNTGPDSILERVQGYVDQGITLTTVGFGMGNYNDVLMEQLANNGDGSYAYVDTLEEARRIFVEGLTGTLQVVAKDAKVQVDFNPEVVSRYRLLGYENRRVDDEDFRNDEVDAGEVGAGHSVTALYEVKFVKEPVADAPAATVAIRYQDPESGEVVELSQSIRREDFHASFQDASPSFQLDAAVAEYAELLRESYWAQDGSLSAVRELAQRLTGLMDQDPDVLEFAYLVSQAERIAGHE